MQSQIFGAHLLNEIRGEEREHFGVLDGVCYIPVDRSGLTVNYNLRKYINVIISQNNRNNL